ncbi:hypothetical protein BST26_10675, partial [Mycolicibacterium insubricum]
MSSNGASTSVYTPPGNRRDERLRVLFDELSELCGQRNAVKLEPRPDTDPKPGPRPGIHKTGGDDYDNWRITLPHIESAKFAAALASHRDALFAQWTR